MTLALLLACRPATPLAEFRSTLPLVVVDTDGEEMGRKNASIWEDEWVDASATVHVEGRADSATDYDGPAAIHVRGNSSREYDKVSYRLELRNQAGDDRDAELLGLPPEADWVLQGPYSDKTLMRNALMYQLSRDIGRYAARTRFVDLFVVDNDRDPSTRHHRGVYVLTEKVERDRERVDLADDGVLLKRDWWDRDDEQQKLTTPVYRDTLIVDHPKALTAEHRDELETWFAAFERSLVGPSWTAFADLDAFVDHMLLVELGRTVDGYVLSTWMSKDVDGLLQMGPIWDYNGALGNADYFAAWKTKGWHYDNPEFPADNRNGFAWYERMLADPAFVARRAERWRTHRRGPLSDAAVTARIEVYRAELAEAAAVNFEVWDVLGEAVWPNDEGAEDRQTYDAEVDYMQSWLLERLAWLDDAV